MDKKIKSLLVLPLLISCNNVEVSDPIETRVYIPAMLNTKARSYEEEFIFRDSYFYDSSYNFNKDLALMSFGLNLDTLTLLDNVRIYNSIGFDNFKFTETYESGPTENSTTMMVAHKKIKDFDLISATFVMEYGKEWVSNFTVGERGNHQGFDYSSSLAKNFIEDYLEEYKDQKIKLWISGYSRGGAIAGLTSTKIMEDNNFHLNEKDIYTYTFESPCYVDKSNKKEYQNIFNLYAEGDIVANVLPTNYNLTRNGKDIIINTNNVINLVKELDKEINFPEFVEYNDIKSDHDNVLKLINGLTNIKDEGYTLTTRKEYVENIEPTLTYFIGLIFNLSYERIFDLVGELSSYNMMDLLMIISNQDRFIETLSTLLNQYGIEFDINEFNIYAVKLFNLVQIIFRNFSSLLTNFDNLKRNIYYHMPEVVYCLLKAL